MTLRQEITTGTPTFRMRALVCEQRARDSTDQTSKHDWEELAIEWHMMANSTAPRMAGCPELKLP